MIAPAIDQVRVRTVNLHDDIKPFIDSPDIAAVRAFVNGGGHPKSYYSAAVQRLQQVTGTVEEQTARELWNAMEVKYVQAVQAEFDAANKERAAGNTKATKPADLFRKYSDDLRRIWVHGGQAAIAAQGLFADIYTEQSLSEGDLRTPDYIDAYTGEKIEDAPAEDRDLEVYLEGLNDELIENPSLRRRGAKLLLKAIFWLDPDLQRKQTLAMSGWKRELIEQANHNRKALGWGDKEVEAFLMVNMSGYDADSDDIAIEDDDTDAHTPPTLLPRDLVMDRALYYSARAEIVAFQKARIEIFQRMNTLGVSPLDWKHEFHILLNASDEKDALVRAINDIAQENAVTAAVIYVSVAGDYGLTENDIKHIRARHYDVEGDGYQWVHLASFAEEWEEDLLEMHQDSLRRKSPMSENAIDEYVQHTLSDIASKMPRYDVNPMRTASWNTGFTLASMNGADFRKAEEAGWAAWREDMDQNAAVEYNQVFAKTGNRKAAMAAFWHTCNARVPRPQEKIVSFTQAGLKLASGRIVNWWVAALKIKNNELDLSGDTKERLLKALQAQGFGQSIWPLLT